MELDVLSDGTETAVEEKLTDFSSVIAFTADLLDAFRLEGFFQHSVQCLI